MIKILLTSLNKVTPMSRRQSLSLMALVIFLGLMAGITSAQASLKVEEVLGSNPAHNNDLREWFCFTPNQVSWDGNCRTNHEGAEAE